MSTPVTHGELREILKQELAPFATKAELAAKIEPLATKAELAELAAKVETLAAKVETLATKAELELWGGALLARIERSEQRMSAEMARQFGAAHEAMVAMFAAGDEKYETLPDRVHRLEVAVFAPK